MRTRIGLLGGVLVLLIGIGVAALAYQLGVSQGAATTATGSAGTAVVYGPWAYGFGGFHILWILFGLFILFIVARIVLGAIFWRGGWGHGHRHDRWGGPFGAGPWGGDREAYMADLHRRLHERDAAAGQPTGSGQPPTPGGGTVA